LLAASGVFGPPHDAASRKYHLDVGQAVDDSYMVSKHASITIISNLGPDGTPVLDNGGLGSYEVVWHTDNSYVKVPPAGSMLYSLEVPVNGGGDTSFNNQVLAYEDLPEDLKRAIEGKSQVHDSSRNSAGVLRPGVKLPTKPEEVEGPTHPLVRVHPGSGRKALWVGIHATHIKGMSLAEGRMLLADLLEHATQREFVYQHAWRPGDSVMWDNRAVLHRGRPWPDDQPRYVCRTTITATDTDGLAEMWPAAA